MKFLKFTIDHFKGIGHIELDLHGRTVDGVTTLVGLNESGKTTVLDAINFFQEDDLPETSRHTLIPKKDKFRFDDAVSVKAVLELDENDEKLIREFAENNKFIVHPSHKVIRIEITKSYSFKKSQFQKQDNYFNYTYKLVGHKKNKKDPSDEELPSNDPIYKSIGEYIRTDLCPNIIYYQNFLFDFPAKIYLDSWTNDKQQQRFYRQVLQDVLHSIDKRLDLNNDVLQKMKSGTDEDKEALDHTISLMGAEITREVLGTWGKIFSWKDKQINIKYSSESWESRDSEGNTKDIPRFYVEFELKEGAQPYKITERSLGFNWFFAFLLFTQFRKSRATDPGETLFLLDEPASNLHSSAQQKLTTVFEKLSDASKLVFSTHSHHLIRPEWLEGAYIVQNTAIDYDNKKLEFDTTQTNVVLTPYKSFVANHPKQSSYFQPILDSLDYKPSELEMVPSIIIFEGKNDFYTFKYAVDVLFKDSYRLNFYPGNGAGRNSGVIRLYESWGRKYIVLLDADYAGEEAIKKYNTEIGPIVTQKIFTLSDVKAAWKGRPTEELFYTTDQMKIIQTFDPKQKRFSKLKFNQALQHLLFTKQHIKLTKTSEKNLQAVLDFIQQKIKE